MKYGYEGAHIEGLIANYEIIEDKICVLYLDGTILEFPFSKELEEGFLQTMLYQAMDRNESNEEYIVKMCIKYSVLKAILKAELGVACIIKADNPSLRTYKDLITFIANIIFFSSIFDFSSFLLSLDELKELEKYDIYLSIRNQLEDINNSKILEKIEKSDIKLNINTLDYYSLRKIKKLRKLLDSKNKEKNIKKLSN